MLVACGGNSTASLRKKMIDSYVETGFTKEEATELVNELSDEEIEELVNELNSDN